MPLAHPGEGAGVRVPVRNLRHKTWEAPSPPEAYIQTTLLHACCDALHVWKYHRCVTTCCQRYLEDMCPATKDKVE